MALPLPQAVLDDFPQVPESLEFLKWEAKEKILYKLVRSDGKIRAVPDMLLRAVNEAAPSWTEQRILDY